MLIPYSTVWAETNTFAVERKTKGMVLGLLFIYQATLGIPLWIVLDALRMISNVFVPILQREIFGFDHRVRWIPALQMLA